MAGRSAGSDASEHCGEQTGVRTGLPSLGPGQARIPRRAQRAQGGVRPHLRRLLRTRTDERNHPNRRAQPDLQPALVRRRNLSPGEGAQPRPFPRAVPRILRQLPARVHGTALRRRSRASGIARSIRRADVRSHAQGGRIDRGSRTGSSAGRYSDDGHPHFR